MMTWIHKYIALAAVLSMGWSLMAVLISKLMLLPSHDTGALPDSTDTTRPIRSDEWYDINNDAMVSAADGQDDNGEYEYTSPIYEALEFRNQPVPLPIQVMRQYKQWHSEESLRRDPQNRKFAIIFYSCPAQAGNRLHDFLNGMLWSILTNRTVLWKYWDYPTCDQHAVCHKNIACHENATIDECNPILARAPWIPWYDEWKDQLDLPEPFAIPFYATHPKEWTTNCVEYTDDVVRGVDTMYNHHRLVTYQQIFYLKIPYLNNLTSAETFLWSENSRTINSNLHDLGSDFLYGMLFRYSFDFTNNLKNSIADIPQEQKDKWKDSYSIALHSRHIMNDDNGCNITSEQHCFERLLLVDDDHRTTSGQQLSIKKKNKTNCVVFLMSDRSCTLEALTSWLTTVQKCQVHVAHHEQLQFAKRKEHGPFSGAGYFQDWVLASNARSAFIGSIRSSSALLRELVAFNSATEVWQQAAMAAMSNGGSNDILEAVRQTRFDDCPLISHFGVDFYGTGEVSRVMQEA